MAIKIEKEVQKFIHEYTNRKGSFFRVSIPDGKCGQIRKQGFLSRTDAVNFATKSYIEILTQEKGVMFAPSKITFAEYSRKWLEQKQFGEIKIATVQRYQGYLDMQLLPYFGSYKLIELEKNHLKKYIEDMRNKGESTASIRGAVCLFKAIIRRAEVDDLISGKGITGVPTPKHKQREARFWDSSQIHFFLNASSHHSSFLLLKFALFTGMRAGEIAGLKWECVHLEKDFGSYRGAIEVKRIYDQKARRIQETTKNGDKRIIPILPEAREVLDKLKQQKEGPFVFGGEYPLDSSHFNRYLQSALKSCPELPVISFHGLRHSFCSYLDGTGMNRRTVSQIMGHRNLNTTARYSHVNDSMLGNETARWLKEQSQQKSSNLRAINF